jgi:hypothetical protein
MKDECTMSFRRSNDDTEVIIRRLLYNQNTSERSEKKTDCDAPKNSYQKCLNGEGVPPLPLEGLEGINQERDGILSSPLSKLFSSSTTVGQE